MSGYELQSDYWVNEYISPWDIYSHGIKRILDYKHTTFQQMSIVESGSYGKALVLDGKWQSCQGDEFIYHEPLVHAAMTLHGSAKKVLILGGGEGATAREVLKWKTVECVLMVDIDGEVVEACKKHLEVMHQGCFDDPRLEVHIGDALDILDTTEEKWDVVISDLSDPIEEGPSFKLFTKEYFEKLPRVLTENGFFVVQSGPVAPPVVQKHARLVKTVNSVFPHVKSYTAYISTYGQPWSFTLGSFQEIENRPDPNAIDELLKENLQGELKMFDGTTMLGIFQLPLHIRKAIEEETEIYTLAKPPKFFGQSQVGK